MFLYNFYISKLYHILGSNHSTFYVWSFQVSFPYKFLVLKMRTLLLTKYMWKTITFHCFPSSRCGAYSSIHIAQMYAFSIFVDRLIWCPLVTKYSSIGGRLFHHLPQMSWLAPICHLNKSMGPRTFDIFKPNIRILEEDYSIIYLNS
jgi:hypothetical protein